MEALKINQEPNIISQAIFGSLLKNAECDTGDDLDTIGFISKWMNYEMSFYVDESYGDDLVIEDFGCMRKGEWIQYQPTKKQKQQLNELISKRRIEIEEENRQKQIEAEELRKDQREFLNDPYSFYGVNRAMF